MLHAVIMAGGAGKRFWPKSRLRHPKQLLKIVGGRTMLEDTLSRALKLCPPSRVLALTAAEQAREVRRQLRQLPASAFVVEPFGRNTAACIGLAAAKVLAGDRDGVMAIMPSDHLIRPERKFVAVMKEAARHADESRSLVTFGVVPSFPATGYGYIRRGALAARVGGVPVYEVGAFTEKPDARTAARFLHSGHYYWNSGMFVWRADVIMEEFAKHLPSHFRGLMRISAALGTRDEARVVRSEFAKFDNVSIDYGVMERSRRTHVIEANYEWDDVGSWNSVERHHKKNEFGNVATCDNVGLDSGGNIIFADKLVATLGVKDLIIVDVDDALLVARKDRSEDVKKLVDMMEKKGLKRLL